MHQQLDLLRPEYTPRPLKFLLGATCFFSIFFQLINPAFSYFNLPKPQAFFLLSLQGLKMGYFWQPITQFFVHFSPVQGLTFWFLLSLFFQLYILWIVSTVLIERISTQTYFLLYFGSGLIASFTYLLFSLIFPAAPFLGGFLAPLIALVTVYALLMPKQEVLFLFLFRLELFPLVFGVFCLTMLVQLSSFDIPSLFYTLSSFLTGYIYALKGLSLSPPFRFLEKLSSPFLSSSQEKIVPYKKLKQEQEDEAFLDAMLDKINKEGEKSLSRFERAKLLRISKKRKR